VEKVKSRFISLRRRADFLNLRESGRRLHVNSWLVVNVQATDRNQVRGGWTIPRQTGTAVVRNRFRRWGRERLRQWARETSVSVDMNIVFKRCDREFFKQIKYKEFTDAMDVLFVKVERLGRSHRS